MSVSRAFELRQPWLGIGSTLQRGVATRRLNDLFDPRASPNQYPLDKRGNILAAMVERIKAYIDAEDLQRKQGVGSAPAFLTKHAQQVSEQRKRVVDAARQTLSGVIGLG